MAKDLGEYFTPPTKYYRRFFTCSNTSEDYYGVMTIKLTLDNDSPLLMSGS